MNQEKLNDVLIKLRTPLQNYTIKDLNELQGDLLVLIFDADKDCPTANLLALELKRVCSIRNEKAFDHYRSNMTEEQFWKIMS